MHYRATGFNEACSRCRLSCGGAIPGQSNKPLDQVKLVIVSAYPGTEEMKHGATLVPAEGYTNAGAFLRVKLSDIFDKDPEVPEEFKPFDDYVFKTNAIKCPITPSEKMETAIKACKTWLTNELKQLPKRVPILIAASPALASLTLDVPGKYGINKNRAEVIDIKGYPCLTTYNPIEALRYTPLEGAKNTPVEPVIGSIPWVFIQDLTQMKSLVLNFIKNGNRV